jgi:hypothetical protein
MWKPLAGASEGIHCVRTRPSEQIGDRLPDIGLKSPASGIKGVFLVPYIPNELTTAFGRARCRGFQGKLIMTVGCHFVL